jgi:formate-dependent nitrite reductase cytochrome c552 subunit
MLSRIFWIGIAGIALVAGMVMQDGNRIFSWGDDADAARGVGHKVEMSVDSAIDRSFDKMTVVGSDGEEIEIPAETKRAMGEAVGRLVKAETELALLRVRDGSKAEIEAAAVRRDQARADVETLKDRIENQKTIVEDKREAVRDQVRQEVRETVREAVRN